MGVHLRMVGALCLAALSTAASAENLYRNSGWPAMSGDRRASSVGDALTIVIFQAAEATNTAQNSSNRGTNVGGGLRAGPIDESGELRFGGSYSGRGEVRRSERFVAQIT
ncbi:flagellar basal body L-ring protein FlgH, partial [Sphingosinicella sp.]|uniref:flagellar basal body L-ring protein FlgH n=1 Tax=Sphingosinicella sp. TaxID=1917971 RepID=UPI004037C2E0